jgi:ATP-dependent Clp protease adaptor protein ClpS
MSNNLNHENTGNFAESGNTDVPGMYQIVLHHDEFTTMEFVLEILEKFFYLDRHKAIEIMLEAKQQGRACCGMFSKDVAATKIHEVTESATSKEFPLFCSMEAA